jgi:hypothetical protein
MRAELKAEELVNWAINHGASKEVAKLFADKIVYEILYICNVKPFSLHKQKIIYYIKVRKEIEKL